MSCTHDCGCTPEIRDARTDEWVQITPDSARPATLTPEQPVKAPGQGGDIFLTRGNPVEIEFSSSGNRVLRYVDEGGYQYIAGEVGNGMPCPWEDARIIRVLTEDKPAQEPVLPRRIKPGDYEVERVAATIHADVTAAQAINIEAVYRSTGLNLSGGSHDFANIAWDAARAVVRDFDVRLIKEPAAVDEASPEAPPAFEPSEPVLPRPIDPEDVRVGMVVERRKGEAAHRDRVQQIDGGLIVGTDGAWLWVPGNADGGWSLWLIGDAPAPVDPDAEALDLMAQAMANLVGSDDADEWVPWAEVALDALRKTHDVTARAEQ